MALFGLIGQVNVNNLDQNLVKQAKAELRHKGHPLTASAIMCVYRDLELKQEAKQHDSRWAGRR